MKKLIIIGLFLSSNLFGATVTNKIVNTLTITSTNSPVEIGMYLTAGSTMAQTASPQPFTHLLANYGPSNPTFFIWNTSPIGNSGFTMKDSLGNNLAGLNFECVTSNLFMLNSAPNKAIVLQNPGGSSVMTLTATVTTNHTAFVVTGASTFNGGMNIGANPGLSLSVTNLGPVLGSSNVMVYASGVLTNKFTIP